MTDVQRGLITRDDVAHWDGVTRTSSRVDATGGTVTGLNFGDVVDILQVFGSGTSRSAATINTAIGRLGGATATFLFSTGTWTIADNLTIPSTITCLVPQGAIFSVDSGKTLTINGFLQVGIYQVFSGSGTIAGLGRNNYMLPYWWQENSVPGTTDLFAAIQAAITAQAQNQQPVQLLAEQHLVTAELVADFVGFRMFGAGSLGPSNTKTEIISSATSGAVLRIKQRYPQLSGIKIASTAARLAASTTTGHGIFTGKDDTSGVISMSRQFFDDIYIENQPTDGLHVLGACELSEYTNITAVDCKRHGYVFDDGTTAGYTNKQTAPFQWVMRNTRAFECGGHGYVIGTTADTNQPFGLTAINMESLGCAWNSSHHIDSKNYQMVDYGRDTTLISPDFEDQQYDQTTTSSTGMTRTGLAAPSGGMYFFSGFATIIKPYFSSLVESINADAPGMDIQHPTMAAGGYNIGTPQPIGITLGNKVGCRVVATTGATSGATIIVKTTAEESSYNIDGKEYIGLTLSTGDFERGAIGDEILTIASGVIPQLTADYVTIASESGATDSAALMNFNGARDGVEVTLQADAGDTITIVDGTVTSGIAKGFVLGANRILVGNDGDMLKVKYNTAGDVFVQIAFMEP